MLLLQTRRLTASPAEMLETESREWTLNISSFHKAFIYCPPPLPPNHSRGTKAVKLGTSSVDPSKPTIYRGHVSQKNSVLRGFNMTLLTPTPPPGSSAAFIFGSALKGGGCLTIWLERRAPFAHRARLWDAVPGIVPAESSLCRPVVMWQEASLCLHSQDAGMWAAPDQEYVFCHSLISVRGSDGAECSGNPLTVIGTGRFCAQANPSLLDRKPQFSGPNICLFQRHQCWLFHAGQARPPSPNVKNSPNRGMYGPRCAQQDSNSCLNPSYVKGP